MAPCRFASRSPSLLPSDSTVGRMGRISPVSVSGSMLGLGVSVISAPMDRQADVIERHLYWCVWFVDGDVHPADARVGEADVGQPLRQGLDQRHGIGPDRGVQALGQLAVVHGAVQVVSTGGPARVE